MKYKKKEIKTEKKLNNIKYIIFSLIVFFIIIASIFFIKSIRIGESISQNKFQIQENHIFDKEKTSKNNYYSLMFTINKDFTISGDIKIYDHLTKNYIKIPSDLYAKYDNNYYSIHNIINVIKQNRAENANKNFLLFMENLIGLKFDSYAYTYSDNQNILLTNRIELNWQDMINPDETSIELNKSKFILSNDVNVKIYDQDQNDEVLRSIQRSSKYKDIRIEIYNSTNISGYGNKFSRLLQNMGFRVVRVLNYEKSYPDTILFDLENDQSYLSDITDILNINIIKKELPTDINTVADYVIILGGDSIVLF